MYLTPEQMRQRCELLVVANVGQQQATQWWASPNKAFDMYSPQTMWSKDPKMVYQYLMHYAYR